MAATVTIERVYFETLLRRAEFDVSGANLTTPVDLPTVSIPKIDHDNLIRISQEYTSLREALYRGGIAPETLEILLRGNIVTQPQADVYAARGGPTRSGANLLSPPQNASTNLSRSANAGDLTESGWPSTFQFGAGHLRDKNGLYNRQYSFIQDDSSFLSEPEKDEQWIPMPRNDKPQYARNEQRTILVRNLSDRATHKDFVDIVRGGPVLDIFLRLNERSASVSFLEGSAAQDFMNYVRRNDIYVHGKRLEFSWNDRQFILPGHVANKIGIGATRNLVVRGVHPNITDERLREDLDHIHNLVIISISFQKGDAFISLNSIHNALFARTCMMSRATYKGMKIEWYPDECTQPLPKSQSTPKSENAQQPSKKSQSMVNRFQMLNIDGTEDGSEEDEEDRTAVSAAFSGFRLDHRSPWNVNSIAA